MTAFIIQLEGPRRERYIGNESISVEVPLAQ